jgi:hypothetical protein
MAWSTAGRNARAEATGALIANVSLHTGDPGASGTDNEWTGGGYARQSVTFGSATNGVVTNTAPLEFTGPASTTAAYAGFWATGPTFLGAVARTSGDAAANAEGQYNISTLTVTATGDITAA